jgi:hypothetical protein
MLVMTRENETLIVTGKTFDIKDEIKTLGGRWDATRGAWTLPDTEETRAKLTAASEKLKASRKAVKAPDARAVVKSCLEEKAKTGKFHWICCEECVVVNWARQHTTCAACAKWDGQSWNSFRVRGNLYTGT